MSAAEPGTLLAGRYRLRTVIGHGGMGTVWLAGDQLLHRDVAVKEIRWPAQLDPAERENLRQRALREARTAARLNHPGIVGVYDVVEQDGRPWIVMQLLPYRSLKDVVQEDGPLSPEHAAQVGLQVLAALRAAHAAGVLHRDVKPGNVLLGSEGRVVLTDFGVATAEGGTTLTTVGVLIGSPSYIAPERARGERATPAADLWSLGATLYAAVEGRPPFARNGTMAVLTAVVTEDPDPPHHAGPLWPVISELLRKDPADRPSADEVKRLLRAVADGHRAVPAAPLEEPTFPLGPLQWPAPGGIRPEAVAPPTAVEGSPAGPVAEPEQVEGSPAVPMAQPEQVEGSPAGPVGEPRQVGEFPAGLVGEPEQVEGSPAGPVAEPAQVEGSPAGSAAEPAQREQSPAGPVGGFAAAAAAAAAAVAAASAPAGDGNPARGAGPAPERSTAAGWAAAAAPGPRTGTAEEAPGTETANLEPPPLIPGLKSVDPNRQDWDAESGSGWGSRSGSVATARPPQRRRPRPRWQFLAGALVAAAAVAAIAIAVTLSGGGAQPHRAGSSASPAAPKASAQQSAPRRSTQTPTSASPPPTTPARGGAAVLPAGFVWYHDPTGFSIGVPANWDVSHEGPYVYVRDPRGGRFLLIDQTDHPKPDPLADWRQQEANRISTYPGYQRIRLEAVQYAQAEKAADWEFTYYQNGLLTHVLNRNVLANANHAYALYWSTPASEWNASFHYFQGFAATFRPAGANQGS